MIRRATCDDAHAIAQIYNHYIDNTIITFETTPVSADAMRERIEKINKRYPFFVCQERGQVVGYCYASVWKDRSAYDTTVESTVYVSHEHGGRGIGTLLMKTLIETLINSGIHAIVAIISIPNDESIRMHDKLGFTKVAHLRQVGRKFDRWIDVGNWQLIPKSKIEPDYEPSCPCGANDYCRC